MSKRSQVGAVCHGHSRPIVELSYRRAWPCVLLNCCASVAPQYLLSSPALRAKTTANIFAETLGLGEPSYNQSIYEASYTTLLKVVNGLPDAYDFVAMFGHNPGLSDLLYELTGNLYDMPTCAVAPQQVFRFNIL